MASEKEILTKYMEIIDSLKYAYAHAKSIDGELSVSINTVIEKAIPAASRMAYRIQREMWDANGGTYEG